MSKVRSDNISNRADDGAPKLVFGAEVPVGYGITGAGGINITGIATATSFSGATGTFTGDVDIADKIIHTGDTNTVIRFPAADTFTVETAGSEAIRVDSSGRLLVGTTAAGSNGTADDLVVANNDSASDQAGITIRGGTSGRSQIFFSDGTSGDAEYRGMLRYDHSDESMQFRTAATERLRILSDGTVATGGLSATPGTVAAGSIINANANAGFFSNGYDGKFGTSSNHPVYFQVNGSSKASITSAGNLTINDGNLVVASGHGIDFSATNDPGIISSELLDDYEEGTWTPTIGGNATYTNQVGTYVKVGRMVYAHWALTINAQGTGSNISAISGLPYPSGVASQATSNLLWSGFGVSMAYAAYYVGNGGTTMNLSYIATAAAALTNNPNGLVNGATMNGTIVYYSSS